MAVEKSERINIRCSTKEKEEIKNAMKESGFDNISEYLIHSALFLGYKDRKAQILLKQARPFLIKLMESDRTKAIAIQGLPEMAGFTQENRVEAISELRAEIGRCDYLIDQIDDYITI